MHSIGNDYLIVDAVISSDKIFKIPKQKVGKFVVGRTDMTNNFQQSTNASLGSDGLVNGLIKFFANTQPQMKTEISNEKIKEKIEEISNEDESDADEIRSNYSLYLLSKIKNLN